MKKAENVNFSLVPYTEEESDALDFVVLDGTPYQYPGYKVKALYQVNQFGNGFISKTFDRVNDTGDGFVSMVLLEVIDGTSVVDTFDSTFDSTFG